MNSGPYVSVAFSQHHLLQHLSRNDRRPCMGFCAAPSPCEAGNHGPDVVARRQGRGPASHRPPPLQLLQSLRGLLAQTPGHSAQAPVVPGVPLLTKMSATVGVVSLHRGYRQARTLPLWLLKCSFCVDRTLRNTADTGQAPTKL